MTKTKIEFICNACGAVFPKWQGQCLDCGAWNSIIEEKALATSKNQQPRLGGYAGNSETKITLLSEIALEAQPRIKTKLTELDHVLGGGLVLGSVVLIGGDPGIGKSTLLLQTL